MDLLIALPVKAGLHPQLKARARELADAVLADERNRALFDMRLAWHEDDGPPEPQPGRWGKQAWARNELLREHLQDGDDYVFMVDADLTDYPADLPAQLYEANPDGITAPMVMIEGSRQFYDTLGFIQNGRRLVHLPPYFHGVNGSALVDLDAVGCVYLAPADVLRKTPYASLAVDQERHHFSVWTHGHTDHWPVCQAAKEAGLRVACLRSAKAEHARLPDYGEDFH